MRLRPLTFPLLTILAISVGLAVWAGLFGSEPSSPVAPAALAGSRAAVSEAPLNGQVKNPDEFERGEAVASQNPAGAEDLAAGSGTGGPFIPLETGAGAPPRGIEDLATADIERPAVPEASLRPEAKQAEPGSAGAPLDAMIGQMIMVGFKGTAPTDPWPARLIGQIADGKVGGILFLERNATSFEGVRALNQAFQQAGGATPVFIAVDQEGGQIERLTQRVGFPELPAPREVARSMSAAKAGELYARLASDLKKWKFNLNLGPVVDVDINPRNPIIGALGRSFSSDAVTVTQFGKAFIQGHHKEGVLTAVKHFPGHGSSREDSHKGFVDITATWSPKELDPYRQLIKANLVDMVMTGHLYLAQLAGENSRLPASLSKTAIDVLRTDLGFQGVVISDDMEMKAIEAQYTVEDAAVAAVSAGTNILIYSNYANPRPDIPERIGAVLKQRAQADPQFRGQIEASYRKILRLKRRISTAQAAMREPIAEMSAAPASEMPLPPASGEARMSTFERKSPFIVPNLN